MPMPSFYYAITPAAAATIIDADGHLFSLT